MRPGVGTLHLAGLGLSRAGGGEDAPLGCPATILAHFLKVCPAPPRLPMSSGSAAPQQTTLHTNCCVFIYCRTLDCPHTWPPVGTHPRSNTLMYRSRRVRSKPVLQNWRRGRAPPPPRPPGNHGNGKAAEGLRVHTCPCIAVQEAAAPPSWPGWSFCAPSQDPGSQLQGTLPLRCPSGSTDA